MKWISIRERIPDDYKEVLIFDKSKEILTAKHTKAYGWSSLAKQEFIVTHWMPLPEPPKD